jgi:hypothetical protein
MMMKCIYREEDIQLL